MSISAPMVRRVDTADLAERDRRFGAAASMVVLGAAMFVWALAWLLDRQSQPSLVGWFLTPVSCVVLTVIVAVRTDAIACRLPRRYLALPVLAAVWVLVPIGDVLVGPVTGLAAALVVLAYMERGWPLGVAAAGVALWCLLTASETTRVFGIALDFDASAFAAIATAALGIAIAFSGPILYTTQRRDRSRTSIASSEATAGMP